VYSICVFEYGMLGGASTSRRLGFNSKQVPAPFVYHLHISFRYILIGCIFWCEVMVSRSRVPDCILDVEAFVSLHEVENPPLKAVKHANVDCMEEVRLREVAHDTWYMSNTLDP